MLVFDISEPVPRGSTPEWVDDLIGVCIWWHGEKSRQHRCGLLLTSTVIMGVAGGLLAIALHITAFTP